LSQHEDVIVLQLLVGFVQRLKNNIRQVVTSADERDIF